MPLSYHQRCVVPMIRNETQQVEFEIVIYGRRAKDLMTVPNDIIGSLARRYPEHTSSMFLIHDL